MIPEYSAPQDVYQTAWTMGINKVINKSYNLTWEFPVDSQFIYLVRLHFCEFQTGINEFGDRVFLIFIADLTAEEEADVMIWSGGKGVPVYRDYAVMMVGNEGEKKMNLSIALQANPIDWKTRYNDAILNCIEIFKLSDFNGNLAGTNPNRRPLIPLQSTKWNDNRTSIIAVVGGVVSSFIVLLILGLLIFRFQRAKRVKESGSSYGTKSTKTCGSTLSCRYFSLAEIKAATKNFDEVSIIGVGGFGDVYRGFIDGGATPVAIKRLKPGSQQGAHEFKTEIEILSQLRHHHLVSLIGFCNDDKEMILVYDYMACGTLCGHLYNTDKPPLPWIIHIVEQHEMSLAEWAPHCYRNGKLHQIVDPYLKGEITPECLKKFGEIAVYCLHDNGTQRPSMNDVVWGLELALQLQESAEKDVLQPQGEKSFDNKESDGLMSSMSEFSEIMNPQGR